MHNNVQYPRGDFIGHHLQKIMGYSMRTKEWHYTEWVGITHLGKTDFGPSFLPKSIFNLLCNMQAWDIADFGFRRIQL